jgi:hypothetical protein
MDSSVLRTLRYITFGRYTPSHDGAYFLDKKTKETEEGEMYLHEMDTLYPMLPVDARGAEEWPSERWNFQDNYGRTVRKVHAQSNPHPIGGDEDTESAKVLTQADLADMLQSVKGIGKKKSAKVLEKYTPAELVVRLEEKPEKMVKEFGWMQEKLLKRVLNAWESLKNKL